MLIKKDIPSFYLPSSELNLNGNLFPQVDIKFEKKKGTINQ